MVPDHKQKVMKMRFCEGRVYYFGNKGMSLLGIPEMRWKVDGDGCYLAPTTPGR